MKIRTEQVIDVSEWDKLVQKTYGRPYKFQQQDGCKGRGVYRIQVPDEEWSDFANDSVPEIVNHTKRGVSFAAWLKRDPRAQLIDDGKIVETDQWAIDLWWSRNFYPDISMVINDLHAKGLLKAGNYTIDIDW